MNEPTFEFQKLEVYQGARRLNIAEGAGKKSPGGKAQRYRTARGSANECAACIEEVRIDGTAPPKLIRRAINLLHRIVSMLTRFIIVWEEDRN